MKYLKIFNLIKRSRNIELSEEEFNEFNIPHQRVIRELKKINGIEIDNSISEAVEFTSESRVVFLKNVIGLNSSRLGSYRDCLENWGDSKNIDSDFMKKVIEISEKIKITHEKIDSIAINNKLYNHLSNEIVNSTFDTIKESELIIEIVKNISLNDFNEIFLDNLGMSSEYFLLISIIFKTSFKLSPLLCMSCIAHYSENSNLLNDLKDKIYKKYDITKKISYYNKLYYEKTIFLIKNNSGIIFTSSIILSSLTMFNYYSNNKTVIPAKLTTFDETKKILSGISKSVGEISGSIIGSYLNSFRKEIFDLAIKPSIENLKEILTKK